MTGAEKKELLEVIEKLNGTITTDEKLSEDLAINILADFKAQVLDNNRPQSYYPDDEDL